MFPSLPWRLVAYAFVFASAFAIGGAAVYKWEQAKLTALHAAFDAFKARAAELGAQQRERVTVLKVQNDKATTAAADGYRASIAAINRYYARRLRLATHSGTCLGGVPPVSGPAARAHATAADVFAAQADTRLGEACTKTTAQLVALQRWVRAQRAAWRQFIHATQYGTGKGR